ncbi:MAG: hypothetical protein ACT4QE_22465 [Anaerolineales bacterium]
MAEIPWNFRIQPDPSREYFVAATSGLEVSWRNPRKIWAFQRYTWRIIEQLNRSAGCVGFALRATFRPLEGSTISVWEDIDSLRRFQKENPHGDAVKVLGSGTKGGFQYAQWKSRGEALPRTWEEAEGHLKPREQSA